LRSGTVTFVFTDIEGSTRLLKELGREQYGAALADHQRILRTKFGERDGREIDTQGDSFLFAFASATEAVEAVVAAQRALTEHDWPSHLPLRVRVGIHTGEAAFTSDRYLGLALHRAARICAVAYGGQILASNTTRELVADDLPAGIVLRDLGEQLLKDFDRPERLFQVSGQSLPQDFPSLGTAKSQLAAAAPGDRQEELARAARAAVARGDVFGLSRKRLASIGIITAAAALLLGVLAFLRESPAPALVVSPGSIGAIDPKTNELVGAVVLGIKPAALAVGADSVWVADPSNDTVLRINPKTRTVSNTIGLAIGPQALAVGEGAVWAAASRNLGNFHSVTSIDPRSNEAREVISIPGADDPHLGGGPLPRAQGPRLAVGEGAVWVAFGAPIHRIDARDPRILATIDGVASTGLAVGEGAVWAPEATDHVVSRIDTTTNQVRQTIPFGAVQPGAVAAGAGAVWIADTARDRIWKIDPVANEVEDTIPVGDGPAAITVAAGAVWVANRFDGTVSRINPTTNSVVQTIHVGKSAVAIAAGEGAIWVLAG
jgi:YVTN family beta-propeller protein